MNLITRRAQIKLAADGAHLLKGKREALLKELLARARELRGLRNELHRRGRMATIAVALARAVLGSSEVRSMAAAGRRDLNVEVHYAKVWGLLLADVDHADIVRGARERGIGLLHCPAHGPEAAEAAERMVEQLVRCAPVEQNIRILGEEVRKVSRRINAIEERLLPRLHDDVRRIGRVLDERDREDLFRLKRLKKRKAASQARP